MSESNKGCSVYCKKKIPQARPFPPSPSFFPHLPIVQTASVIIPEEAVGAHQPLYITDHGSSVSLNTDWQFSRYVFKIYSTLK